MAAQWGNTLLSFRYDTTFKVVQNEKLLILCSWPWDGEDGEPTDWQYTIFVEYQHNDAQRYNYWLVFNYRALSSSEKSRQACVILGLFDRLMRVISVYGNIRIYPLRGSADEKLVIHSTRANQISWWWFITTHGFSHATRSVERVFFQRGIETDVATTKRVKISLSVHTIKCAASRSPDPEVANWYVVLHPTHVAYSNVTVPCNWDCSVPWESFTSALTTASNTAWELLMFVDETSMRTSATILPLLKPRQGAAH